MMKAKYVSQLGMGEQSMKPPGVMKRAFMYSFVLEADHKKLQAVVDAQLNDQAGEEWQYRVVGSHVLVTFMNAAQMTSSSEAVGWLPDREWTAFAFVAVFKPGHILPDRFVLYPLLVVVDTSIAMATGREIWGWKKEVGKIEVPRTGDPARFCCEATLFSTLAVDTEGSVGPLLTIKQTAPWEEPQSTWSSQEEVARGLKDAFSKIWSMTTTLGGKLLDLHGSDHIAALSGHVVTLKQFRAAEDAKVACYQAVVESSLQVDHFYGGGLLLGDWSVEISDVESHALVSQLGMKTSSTTGLGIWLECQFSAPTGRVIWEAGR
jgi:hypothetical protein